MVYSVILNLVKKAHLTLGYVQHLHYLLRYLKSHIRKNLVVTEQKAQLTIELIDISIGPICLNGLKCNARLFKLPN